MCSYIIDISPEKRLLVYLIELKKTEICNTVTTYMQICFKMLILDQMFDENKTLMK